MKPPQTRSHVRDGISRLGAEARDRSPAPDSLDGHELQVVPVALCQLADSLSCRLSLLARRLKPFANPCVPSLAGYSFLSNLAEQFQVVAGAAQFQRIGRPHLRL
jgi:hypothetical protein